MKIDFNDKELAAKMLVMLLREIAENEFEIRLTDDEELKKSAESNCLFYWILGRLYNEAESRIPVRAYGKIRVKGEYQSDKILLKVGEEEISSFQDEYLPRYVHGYDFLVVIQDTLEIFESLEEYSTTYEELDATGCEFTVMFCKKGV